ncbi:Hpt domain-containing protein [Isoptericola aurantiacus]|uniref:Hpt domain-containing protein n=1 Tax=Isoptericola aurantiacus TaxID=3377839 RepID=UPI003839E580
MNGRTPRSEDDERLETAVAEIARTARLRNRARVERLVALLGPDGSVADRAVRDEALRLSHAIAGSAGTFGDVDLAEAARDLESVLEAGVPGDGTADDGTADDGARDALERLRVEGAGSP